MSRDTAGAATWYDAVEGFVWSVLSRYLQPKGFSQERCDGPTTVHQGGEMEDNNGGRPACSTHNKGRVEVGMRAINLR